MSKQRKLLLEYCKTHGVKIEELQEGLGVKSINRVVPYKRNRKSYSSREEARVYGHLERAVVVGLPATLTVDEWISTLDYFNWKCAYCQKKPYYALEHYLPMIVKEGTTKENCVPACRSCNAQKGSLLPEEVKSLPKECMDRVKNILKARLCDFSCN